VTFIQEFILTFLGASNWNNKQHEDERCHFSCLNRIWDALTVVFKFDQLASGHA